MNTRILAIHNPAAGQRGPARFDQVIACLEALGAQVEVRPTRKAGELPGIVAGAARDRWDCVAVAGGDGSLMEAVNGVGAHTPPLALIPAGTANVVSLELGIPAAADALARAIRKGHTRTVNIADANGKRFVFAAGAGFDSHVVATVSPTLKKRIGKMAFGTAAASAIRHYRFPPFEIAVDGTPYRGFGVVVLNGARYAGHHIAAPGGDLSNDTVAVVVLQKPGPVAALRYVAALGRDRLSSQPDVVFIARANIVQINGPADVPAQADGELIGTLPLTVRANAARVEMVVPA